MMYDKIDIKASVLNNFFLFGLFFIDKRKYNTAPMNTVAKIQYNDSESIVILALSSGIETKSAKDILQLTNIDNNEIVAILTIFFIILILQPDIFNNLLFIIFHCYHKCID